MKKIPSLFVRDYEGTRLVVNQVVPICEWVQQGEGLATRKWDGTCCMIEKEVLYKRYDRKKVGNEYKPAPAGWRKAQEPDPVTGHWPGWVPVTSTAPEDKWFMEGLHNTSDLIDGTYELCGPNINGNPENCPEHILIAHGVVQYPAAPTTFDELIKWFMPRDIEGIVWHHPDGRMAKIKKKDFGMPRKEIS